jgi:glycerol-3-phosphate dehydrogenase subunit B
VRRAGAPLAIVPAVLGRRAWQPVHGVLERAAGVPVGEALGVPPSLPGLRLHDALERALEAAGVEVLAGRVAASTAHGDVLEAVCRADLPGPRLEAAAFVLATGRFLGGGIVADPEWREPALTTPLSVTHLGAEFTLMEPLALSSADLAGAQPWLGAGVRIDARSRPVGADGEARYRNVHAAGTVIAGHAADLGEAARSGWHAGTLAAASAGAPAR